MTPTELQRILQSNEKLSVKQVKEIIFELKQDCFEEAYNVHKKYKTNDTTNLESVGVYDIHKTLDTLLEEKFYNGETNAFYICLDLLEKVGESKETPMKVEWEESGVRVCPNCKHKSYYCVGGSEEPYPKQPDDYCSKCGQKFIKE